MVVPARWVRFPLTVRARSPVPRVTSPRVRAVEFVTLAALVPVADRARATFELMLLLALFGVITPPVEATARVAGLEAVAVRAPVWVMSPLAVIRVVWPRVPKFR